MLAEIVNLDRSDMVGEHQIISHTAMFYVRHGKSHEHLYLYSNETFCALSDKIPFVIIRCFG